MPVERTIRLAVVGLEFGRGFLPAYLHHAHVGEVAICDTNPDTLQRVGEEFGIDRRYQRLEQVLEQKDIDAVNLFTAIPDHADQAVATLEAGKHCASAVPMATTIDDCRRIIDAVHRSGLNYMMMETSVASPEYFFVRDMVDRGEFGRIQFLRGTWYHDLENHPSYWLGLPPMHYTTHPVSPILDLTGTRASRVHCFGSGWMRQELRDNYGQPFPIETAIFRLHEHDAAVEITSMMFHTATQPKETFDLYGEHYSFTWKTFYDDKHALVKLLPAREGGPKTSPCTVLRMDVPSARDRLPRELQRLAGPYAAQPHLVHEFVSSIIEQRKAWINEVRAADWTAPGLCAHQSAMAGGQAVDIPAFD